MRRSCSRHDRPANLGPLTVELATKRAREKITCLLYRTRTPKGHRARDLPSKAIVSFQIRTYRLFHNVTYAISRRVPYRRAILSSSRFSIRKNMESFCCSKLNSILFLNILLSPLKLRTIFLVNISIILILKNWMQSISFFFFKIMFFESVIYIYFDLNNKEKYKIYCKYSFMNMATFTNRRCQDAKKTLEKSNVSWDYSNLTNL